MLPQRPKNIGNRSDSPITRNPDAVKEIIYIEDVPDEDMIEAERDSIFGKSGENIVKAVFEPPRQELQPFLAKQSNQVVHQMTRPDTKITNANKDDDDDEDEEGDEEWDEEGNDEEGDEGDKEDRSDEESRSQLWSLSKMHLQAIHDAYKLENQKLIDELVRLRSRKIERYLAYIEAIHERMDNDSETIGCLREKLMAAGLKYEVWKDVDNLLIDLEESHAGSSEDLVDVAFEIQKDIDEDAGNV